MEKERKIRERQDIKNKIELIKKGDSTQVVPEYWKNKKDYVEKPSYTSCILYNRKKKKYWAQEDVLLTEELKDENAVV